MRDKRDLCVDKNYPLSDSYSRISWDFSKYVSSKILNLHMLFKKCTYADPITPELDSAGETQIHPEV